MANYQRQRFPFACRGMNLSLPVDMLPPEKYRYLQNIRPYGENQIQMRQGLTKIADLTPDVPRCAKRFDDPVPPPVQYPTAFNEHVRLYGAGTSLYIAASNGIVDP